LIGQCDGTALDIDFEMYGKDLIESAILSYKNNKFARKEKPLLALLMSYF
jgi:lysyl-tRNA synthetase class I